MSPAVVDLLERRVYDMAQVDRLLGLSGGTAKRWIDGYERGSRTYPPVVRIEPTGDTIVTWGEFVETRLLSEYRSAGVPMHRMRPAVERLRERLDTSYPLARARPFASGKELVLEVQEAVGLHRRLQLVVVRNDQLVLTEPARNFYESVDFAGDDGVAERLRPVAGISEVVIDPLRQFGEPVVRSVPTEVIAEQVRAGEHIDAIVELYDLTRTQIEAALRFELMRRSPETLAA
jgi:uncharacterized protein (DUF433 family)